MPIEILSRGLHPRGEWQDSARSVIAVLGSWRTRCDGQRSHCVAASCGRGTSSCTSKSETPRDRLRATSAEGFARYKHKDFARFVRIAKGSEVELLNHFQEAFDGGYMSEVERQALEHAAKKAIKAANGLIRYLDSSPDPE